jgi:outer membrane protein OmpA-like peptidoglycan-associated protein
MIITKKSCGFLLFIILTLVFLISGCAKTTVVLLPDPDGKVGHVTVSNDAGSIDISQAREATVVRGRESLPTAPAILSEDDIKANFSPVLAILPSQPIHFILYFKGDSTDLTADSIKILPEILESIKSRNSQNISVIGHTDTAGDQQYNLQLSRRRASAISRILVKKGVDSSFIISTSHGEENPLIKTADNVHEARNRRVEVVVR